MSLRAALKWPNDVLLTSEGNRKVCGILCEYRPALRSAEALVVVGIGINVSQTRDQLPVDTATSLALAGAGDVDREDLLTTVLDRFAGMPPWRRVGRRRTGCGRHTGVPV